MLCKNSKNSGRHDTMSFAKFPISYNGERLKKLINFYFKDFKYIPF
jgi:hypothetical protein